MTATDKSKTTLEDLARMAGVSISTVSRVFTRPELLSRATVDRVRQVAAELGYLGNHAARALVTGRFHNLAMIVPDIANPFFPPLVRAIQNRADELGYAVFLGDTDERGERERTLLSRLGGQVDGFILAGTRLDEITVREVSLTRPTILVNRDIESVSRILIDSSSGVRDAVRHLHRLGHRDIAYLAGPADSWSNQQRRAAAREATDAHGMRLIVLELGRSTFEGGREVVDRVIDTRATAAVAFDDVMAHGLLTGLRARGLDVPRDFSVIGCDDALGIGIGTEPPLTTISHSADDAGVQTVDLLLGVVSHEITSPERVAIPTRLVHRQTTAAPPRT